MWVWVFFGDCKLVESFLRHLFFFTEMTWVKVWINVDSTCVHKQIIKWIWTILQYSLNLTSIVDKPRFKHRAVLLDSSRHYLSKAVLLENLVSHDNMLKLASVEVMIIKILTYLVILVNAKNYVIWSCRILSDYIHVNQRFCPSMF